MDLILWRHAEAEPLREGGDDLSRLLSPKGERVLSSPARRTEQTVRALGRPYKLREELGPDATPADVLALLKWDAAHGPQGKRPVLLVGHQPWLGQVAARLLRFQEPECAVRKGAVWWLRARLREGRWQTALVTVASPELISRSWDARS